MHKLSYCPDTSVQPALALVQCRLQKEKEMISFPEPFIHFATIEYEITRSGHVELAIVNPLGRVVKQLADKTQRNGRHHVVWDGKDKNGSDCPGGLFYCRLTTSDRSVTRKMTLV